MKIIKYFALASALCTGASSPVHADTRLSDKFQDGDPNGRAASGSDDDYDELTGSGNVSRTLLSYSTLMNGSGPGSRINLSAYALPANAAHPQHTFAGRLTLGGETSGGSFAEIKDGNAHAGATIRAGSWPAARTPPPPGTAPYAQ